MTLVFGLWLGACNSTRPSSPVRVVSLNVAIPATNELRSSLLTAASNELLYRVDGPGMTTIKGTLGPFASPAATGSIDFNLDIPTGPKEVLSLQLNDAATHKPLAVGAAGLDFSGSAPLTEVVVEMGSVTRLCYVMDQFATALGGTGSVYGFATDSQFNQLAMGPSYDVALMPVSTGTAYFIQDGQNVTPTLNCIAYLGNGNWVDSDYVPPDGDFYPSSTQAKGGPVSTVQVGDIYCVKLSTMRGHAWLRIVDPGKGGFGYGPSFQFRVNSTVPYFAYESIQADINGVCSTIY